MVRGKTEMRRIENATSSMQEIIERYQRHTKDVQGEKPSVEQNNVQNLKHDTISLMEKIQLLETSKRKLMGESLESCSLEELKQMEHQLERSVNIIRARKMEVFRKQIERLKETVKDLESENTMLLKKCGDVEKQQTSGGEELSIVSSEKSDVETELFIGLPECKTKRSF